ncbi:hypothetical protein A2U01_0080175 [Trifolium medium]|uniref:Uncharacterized protein n=1 Tax=Trifolium medium TaxID=97028 RepID=A0A392TFB5_9FABA|nr:hypothetical protein [Trifolium medium]
MEKGSSSNVSVNITAEAKDTKVIAGSQHAEANKYAYMNNYKGKNPMTRRDKPFGHLQRPCTEDELG